MMFVVIRRVSSDGPCTWPHLSTISCAAREASRKNRQGNFKFGGRADEEKRRSFLGDSKERADETDRGCITVRN
jgi:hypothetical protein